MKIYQAGADVALQFPLTDENDNAVEPSAVSWRLLDDLEAVLVADQALVGPFADFVDIVVPGVNVTLPTGAILVARTVELTITTSEGPLYKRASFGVSARQRLQILVNSFQTLTQAELEASLVPGVKAWHDASEDEKVVAMSEAYRRLTRVGYTVDQTTISSRFWPSMTLDSFNTLYPEDFRSALRKAQVSEADEVLDAAASGRIAPPRDIVMEQIGQSKTQYRDVKPLNLGLSKRTLGLLEGYINFRLTLARA